MKIKWTFEAKMSYYDTLDYWYKHNGSYEYSLKIMEATKEVESKISENPYLSSKYSKKLNLFKIFFLKGKFVLYYKILIQENTIEIYSFRSTKQKPIFM